jgi:hypothetical protein
MNSGPSWADSVSSLTAVSCTRRALGAELVDASLTGGSRSRERILEKNGMCLDFCCFGLQYECHHNEGNNIE